jgi:hypothetical protein
MRSVPHRVTDVCYECYDVYSFLEKLRSSVPDDLVKYDHPSTHWSHAVTYRSVSVSARKGSASTASCK